jgi:hypothetical protein
MTSEEIHKRIHEELHGHLGGLVADFLALNPGKHLNDTTIMELIEWSHQQTLKPTHPYQQDVPR